jgi:Xaa-Pro aminopeptidase
VHHPALHLTGRGGDQSSAGRTGGSAGADPPFAIIGAVDRAAVRSRLAARLDDLGAEAFLVTRQPNVRYLSGFTGSNGQLLLSRSDAVFLTDGRYTEQARREVPDLRRGRYSGEFAAVFGRACADLGVRRVAFEAMGVTFAAYQRLAEAGPELVPTSGEVERLRWVKWPGEVRRIEAAQAVADEAFDLVTGKLVEGATERDVAFELDTAMRGAGAEAVAFESIVAFGENAAEPHHAPGERPLARGDVVKLDFGAVVDGYHSDMTRTVAFGEPPHVIREIHEVVLRAQRAGIAAATAGAPGAAVDEAAREAIRDAGFGDAFPHSVGHGVGLEVHEGPALRPGNDDVLPAGAVVTVEPGVYLQGVGGVRVEDMVEVRAGGPPRILPRSPRELLVL